MKIVTQAQDQWYSHVNHGPVDIQDVQISNGGLLLVNGDTVDPNDHFTLKNVGNLKGSDHGGMQVIMLWPNGLPSGAQQAIANFTLDNTHSSLKIHQGTAETALRGKCDNAQIIGTTFVGALNPDGSPIKQVVQVRHGKKWLFQNCSFISSWPDLGQQKDASLNNGQGGYVTSQHVGTVIFDQCHFTKWNGHLVYSRQPGVDHIIFTNCIDPDGKKFSKTV